MQNKKKGIEGTGLLRRTREGKIGESQIINKKTTNHF